MALVFDRRDIMASSVLRVAARVVLLGGGLGLAACGGDTGSVQPLPGAAYTDPTGGASGVAGAGRANAQQEAGASLQVNKYLWRGALETLGFMPFASTDPFGGVIVTDWYAPPAAQGERFKATAYVLGRELRADGLKVTIFRQVRDGGEWVDAPVNPATAADIEGKVLARARELRARGVK